MKKFFKSPKLTLRLLVMLAILLALGLVLGRFSVGSSVFKMSPAFAANTIIGAVGGPIWAAVTLAAGDVLGFFLFPSGYGFFIGYTFSAAVIGLLYGAFFYGKRLRWERWQDWLYTFVAFTVIIVIYSIGLGTLWIVITYKMPYLVALFSHGRILALVEIPIETVVIMLIMPPLQKIPQIARFMGLKE